MLDVRTARTDPSATPWAPPDEPAAVRRAAGELARSLPPGRSRIAADGLTGERLAAAVEGLVLGAYRFRAPASKEIPGPTRVELCGAAAADDTVARAHDAAATTCWARDLANTPAGTKTPAWLAAQAERELRPLGVTVTGHDERWLAEHGFGGVLAVGSGSASPPRLIEASWRPRGARRGIHLVLVGKGITFDTGGVNKKPGDSMRMMHTDMAGSAAVLGALRLIAARRTPVRVTALVPSAENALSGSSYRPSDVVRHYGGRTSEIANTDAEGRIVLADALAYAAATLRPTAMIDIATLTGAAKIALGLRTGALFATSEPLADGLLAAGAAVDEPLWRLPMPADYESTLNSAVADANNSPGNPGAITAALFLKPFTGDVPWAHLDVAGPARASEDDGIFCAGATGYGARLLHAYATELATG